MSLVNPTLGEILDRLSILALKRLHSAAQGLPSEHFDREWTALHTQVIARRLSGPWLAQALELGAVNGELWKASDTMRGLADRYRLDLTPDSTGSTGQFSAPVTLGRAGELGIEILRLNDRRAALIQALNEGCGDWKASEKEKL